MLLDTILFDLDGTLIDTELSAARTLNHCFAEWGISVTQEDASYITGRTWSNAFSYLFSKYRLPVSETSASEHILARYREALDKDLIRVPGSAAAVTALAQKYRLGLVSGSGRSEIFFALNKLDILRHFQIILGAEDYPRSKPEPDGYLKAMQILGSQGAKTLVFEDSRAGIQSARAAGVWVVAVTSTNHFGHDLSAAHHHIPDLTAVTTEWIEKLSLR